MPNPVKGQQLFEEDGTLARVIAELVELEKTFIRTSNTIKQEAGQQARAMRTNRDQLDATTAAQLEQAKQADRLARAYARYQNGLSETQRELARLKVAQRQQSAQLRNEERLARSAEGSYDALAAQYNLNKIRLNAMSREQRQATAAGRQLENQTRELYEEMKRLQEATGRTVLSVGDYRGSIKDAFTDLASSTLGPAAIGAALAGGIIQGAQAAAEMAEEVRKLRGELETLTDLDGEGLDGVTAQVRAITRTFDVAQEEVVQAANAVSKQLGLSFENSLARIEEGLIAGSNANGEFLDSLREYPTFFAEAGLGADQLFQALNRTATEGLYSDKGIDAIKEATLRLREQPQAVQDALEAIGLGSEEVRRLIEEEGIGAAIAAVSRQLGTLRADSPEVGRAIADIFGGAGEDAGLSYLLTLSDLDNATASLIDSSNEYQAQQQELARVNRELADAQVSVSNALGDGSVTVQSVLTQGQAFLLRFLVPVIEYTRDWFGVLQPLGEAVLDLARALGLVSPEADTATASSQLLADAARLLNKPLELVIGALTKVTEGYTAIVRTGRSVLEFLGLLKDEQDGAAETGAAMGRGNRAAWEELQRLREEEEKAQRETEKYNASLQKAKQSTAELKEETESLTAGSLAALSKEVRDIRAELENAVPEDYPGILQRLLGKEQALDDLKDYDRQLRATLARSGSEAVDVLPLPDAEQIAQVTADGLREAQVRIADGADGPKDLFELLGFNLEDEQKEAIGTATRFALQQVNEFFERRSELAERRVDESRDEVRAAEQALAAEQRRAEQGLASNVEARERDLQNAQNAQERALEEQRKAEREQRFIQGLQQTGSLITAAAKIWSQLGFPLALPAIGIMFGSFAASKIRAGQVARRNNRQGRYMVLRDGTPHEYGDDIYVGTDQDGVANYAERGEAQMIIPAPAVSKYGSVLPGLFRAIQGGKLNTWVEGQARMQREAVSRATGIPTASLDTGGMENKLSQIARNTARQTYTDAQGNTVVQEGNHKTIFRA